MLRVVGHRFGPVLRSRPPIDSAAAQIEWSGSMDELAARRRRTTGRFVSDPDRAPSATRDMLKR